MLGEFPEFPELFVTGSPGGSTTHGVETKFQDRLAEPAGGERHQPECENLTSCQTGDFVMKELRK